MSPGAELLALYNQQAVRDGQVKYYTVKVPLQVQNCNDGVKGVEANWLDHMTQHFNNGASLVDGYFHLGNVNDTTSKSVESVFIFQERSDGEPNAVAPTYDAIVVEQWTIIDGLQVKADYVPLLQSLATFGWRLTCVLPTPVIKTNSDGSLSTKQIVFLQRPILDRKRRESKKLIFKPRSKSNKNCSNETTKNKKKKTKKENNEEDTTTSDREKVIKVENRQANAAKGSEQDLRCEGSMGELDLQSEAGGEEDAAETVLKKGGEEEETAPDGEASPEPLGTAEEIDISVTMEAQSKTKEKEDQREAEDDGVMKMDGDEEGGDLVQGEPAGVEVFSKEIESSGQNPEEEPQESV
ncbi:Raftlin Raft-linking protein [Takifugu flavidus]|uniref:Raftlin Raft-linking protein n=1 Tax=Takifugu flavidus TaxID=433684 RepID=A0A5C6PM15_9TELE|nr:Raftlin Raft-linking protein [Takifugu flavidus]